MARRTAHAPPARVLVLLAIVLVLGAKLSLVVEHLLRDKSPDRHVRDVELMGVGRVVEVCVSVRVLLDTE